MGPLERKTTFDILMVRCLTYLTRRAMVQSFRFSLKTIQIYYHLYQENKLCNKICIDKTRVKYQILYIFRGVFVNWKEERVHAGKGRY